jgi:hypothetical protein
VLNPWILVLAFTLGNAFAQSYDPASEAPGCHSYTYTPGCHGEAKFSSDSAYQSCEIRLHSSKFSLDPTRLTLLGCETFCRALVQSVRVVECGESRRAYPLFEEKAPLVPEADRPA